MISNSQLARALGVTLAQVQAQHIKNAAESDKCAEKAESSGKKVYGQTAEQWRASAKMHRERSTAA